MPPTQPRRSRLRPMQRGVRAIMNAVGGDRDRIPERIVDLVATLNRTNPTINMEMVVDAYKLAEHAHAGQFRRSGEPYIIHPIGVTQILADLGADTETIVAALLHDVVEDTPVTREQIANRFGDHVGLLVDGVTKIEKMAARSASEREAESLRKMILAIAEDLRVVLIKIADRMHNMRTIHHMPRHKQAIKARETLTIYAPLAHRLGMQRFKWELEDMSFQCLHPERYEEIRRMVAERQLDNDSYIDQIIFKLTDMLNSVHMNSKVSGRQKHLWSIYEKMTYQGKDFDDIQDLIGVRVIVDSVIDCYSVLGLVHQAWTPIDGRFKDYIAMPKYNQYQSIHTTVMGPGGRLIEVQIRTEAMHYTAEFGVAAHWQYKAKARQGERERPWLNDLVESQVNLGDSEFTRAVQMDLYADEVYVFTPQGDIRQLPLGSTPVDFAFAVHTEIGYRTVGAKVDGRLVPLDYKLVNGETVEILTDKGPNAGPSQGWLEFVGSSRARSKIKAWFSRERREDAIEKGKEDVRRELARTGAGWKQLLASDLLARVVEEHNYDNEDALYRAVGDGHISGQNVASRMVDLARMERTPGVEADEELSMVVAPVQRRAEQHRKDAVLVNGDADVMVSLAKCCAPVPGDPIIGFITRGRGVSVHHEECPNAEALQSQPERLIDVQWNSTQGDTGTFEVSLELQAISRPALLRDITQLLAEIKAPLVAIRSETRNNATVWIHLVLELAGHDHLEHALRSLKRIQGVYSAVRSAPGSV
ncbi:bifunctional (p)ppGpp synthetase/guanosine-3',5'-bis(diphosphate) 3'-pyrophosphohydrolase [Stomatohabitans albus]|uniref:RelA/SpoT family protein n=1 Tax=Stomatohabitans albus TaxID=3110766 RepID=UPI00300C25D8